MTRKEMRQLDLLAESREVEVPAAVQKELQSALVELLLAATRAKEADRDEVDR